MKHINLKNIRHLLIPGILAIFLVGGAYAYYSESLSFANPFHTGVPGVSLVEKFNPTDQWVAGEKKEKIVWFTNEGTLDVLVRFKPVIEWKAGSDDISDKVAQDAITLNWSETFGDQWIKKGDYYYYKKVLKPGTQTDSVLESVTFSKDLSNDGHNGIDYSATQCNVDIQMESIVADLDEAAKWEMKPGISADGTVSWEKVSSGN